MLSAILYLGNVTYKTKSNGREEGLEVGPPEVLARLSELLKVIYFHCHDSILFFVFVIFNLCGGFPSGQGGASGWSTDKEENSHSQWQANPPIQSLRGRPSISGEVFRCTLYTLYSIFYPSYQAITTRDSMAKSLYSALFDWIVLRINHALLNKKDMEESIPVRDNDSQQQRPVKTSVYH